MEKEWKVSSYCLCQYDWWFPQTRSAANKTTWPYPSLSLGQFVLFLLSTISIFSVLLPMLPSVLDIILFTILIIQLLHHLTRFYHFHYRLCSLDSLALYHHMYPYVPNLFRAYWLYHIVTGPMLYRLHHSLHLIIYK